MLECLMSLKFMLYYVNLCYVLCLHFGINSNFWIGNTIQTAITIIFVCIMCICSIYSGVKHLKSLLRVKDLTRA